MGSVWGNALKISIFGESHGGGIGVVLDGFPSGITFDEEFVLSEMARRAPGKNKPLCRRVSPAFIRDTRPAHRFVPSSKTPIPARATTRIFPRSRGRGTPIIPASSVSAAITTRAAAVTCPAV